MTSSGTEVWTIGRLLTWTTEYLQRHGAESPRLDAEVLLAHARGCQRIELYTAFTDPAEESLRASFRELVKRRADGTPVAYLVGRREFYSLSFQVTPAVLIPRPETELVVIEVLDLIKARSEGRDTDQLAPVDVADVGTGSGAIAIAVARHAPNARLAAIDISREALELARANASEHGVAERIDWFQADLLALPDPDRRFDIVASNPPYVSESEWIALAREVRDHEPRRALVGGTTGAETIARLIPEAADRLRPSGWLLLEISPMIEHAVRQLLMADPRFAQVAVVKDLAGHARVVKARRV